LEETTPAPVVLEKNTNTVMVDESIAVLMLC